MIRRSRSRSFTTFVAFSLAALSIAQSSFAEGKKKVRDELSGDALHAWDDAMTLIGQQVPDYEQALVKFEEAYARSHNPRVLFNIGVMEKNRQHPNHYARALLRFRQEQVEGIGRISPQESQDLKDAIAALERQVSSLQIDVNEPDATVTIDGDVAGTTPIAAPITVDVGPRVIVVSKKGFVDATKTVRVDTGVPAKASFVLDPAHKTGLVSVMVEGAPGVTIRIDDKDMGPAPFKGEVDVGTHTVEAVAPGFVTAKKVITVAYKGDPIALSMSIAKERHEGKLRIDTQPPGAAIEIDGKVVATTTWEGPLESMPHQITVKLKGYDTWQQDVNVTDDTNLVRLATLNESKSVGWVAYTFGTLAILGGGGVVSYFVFRKSDPNAIPGTLRSDVGIPVPTNFHFHGLHR
jgi:hypothetical protein